MKSFKKLIVVLTLSLTLGCGGGSVSVQPSQNTFDLSEQVNDKIDILWVVDCSISMQDEIQNVRDNISDFISDFVNLGYDYRIGVITTTAWSYYAYLDDTSLTNLPKFNLLHVGEATSSDSTNGGLLPKFIDSSNPDPIGNFDTNFNVAAANHCGDYNSGGQNVAEYIGDEREMQSLKAFLEHSPDAAGFLRDDAFFATILITDERDASRDYLVPDYANGNNDPGGAVYHDPADYLNYLTNYFGNSDEYRTYAITKMTGSHFLNINHKFATDSGGFVVDIDDSDYSDELSQITTNIIEVASQFDLAELPKIETLQVSYTYNDGSEDVTVNVPIDETETDGYKYFGSGNYIAFFGSYRPPANSQVSIKYDPISL